MRVRLPPRAPMNGRDWGGRTGPHPGTRLRSGRSTSSLVQLLVGSRHRGCGSSSLRNVRHTRRCSESSGYCRYGVWVGLEEVRRQRQKSSLGTREPAMPRIIALIVLVLGSGLVVAGKQPLACQYIEAAGLIWENGRWNRSGFSLLPPFILVMNGDVLTQESVAEALFSLPDQVGCRNVSPQVSCTTGAGAYLFFDPRTNRGGTSYLIGATVDGADRDTLSVAPFTCQKF
jgi:hypothetical protein